MKIPPSYTITSPMLALIVKIETERLHIASLNLPKPLKEKIQRVSLLKSSLYSARIEGNPLKLSDVDTGYKKSQKKLEVFNITKAIRFVDGHVRKGDLKKDILLQIHTLVLKNLSPDAGRLRREASAIFNQAGIAVYMPPPPRTISKLLDDLLSFVNLDTEKFPLIVAFIAHLTFEKIHPFLDGNGRVGRLLTAAILKSRGWDFTFTVPFEEYLDNHKNDYYFHLDKGQENTNDYLLFMLEAFWQQTQTIKAQIEEELKKDQKVFLPPRQEEIYAVISDHRVVSFDMIRRRFTKVPERTLRYDLKKLLDRGLIEKSGETRGRYYRVKNK
jgi:Fic family protein